MLTHVVKRSTETFGRGAASYSDGTSPAFCKRLPADRLSVSARVPFWLSRVEHFMLDAGPEAHKDAWDAHKQAQEAQTGRYEERELVRFVFMASSPADPAGVCVFWFVRKKLTVRRSSVLLT